MIKYTKLLLKKENISYEINEKDNTVEENIKNADFSFFKPYNYELDMRNLKLKKIFYGVGFGALCLGLVFILLRKKPQKICLVL